MAILNYTTKISAGKTAAEIQDKLVRHGANSIRIDYDKVSREPVAIEFETETGSLGHLQYRYEPNVDGVLRTLMKDKTVSGSLKTREHARKVAWRIEKDWLDVQFAKMEATGEPLEKVMIAYLVTKDGTLYDTMVQRHRLALEAGS